MRRSLSDDEAQGAEVHAAVRWRSEEVMHNDPPLSGEAAWPFASGRHLTGRSQAVTFPLGVKLTWNLARRRH